METLNVFVSSTWIDMRAERAAVEIATQRLRSVRFVGMEDFGARSLPTRAISLEEVDRCQIYVGVIGARWGSGITEAEYRRAVERGLPCLIYQKANGDVAQSAADAARIDAWRKELRATHTVCSFDSPEELAARVVGDLHNLVFDRLVVQGIGRLRADYEARIQRFLAEYVGTGGVPVPFGGRDEELQELDTWLADEKSPPYLMLGGPAGRGKSALLVHWVRRLAREQPDVALVYFPISIRFRTNLAGVAFASITARLAALHGEPLLAGPDTPPEVWRELMAAALNRPLPAGRRLLVVLDGADESGDWHPGPDLFPAAPPPGLRVLVSARYLAGDVDARGWMARLGWDRPRVARPLDLAPLTPQGLVGVLRQTSLPLDALSARADVVAELFRLSAGDPLLIHLYVADLWTRGEEVARLQPEDLAALGPGLEGYFRRWWEDQRSLWGDQSPMREPAVSAVLNTLACALGPLQSAELMELLPANSPLDLWGVDDVMQTLRRFVVGDGHQQGYAMSHPRLGDYFYEQLSRAGRAREQETRFVDWGRSVLDDLANGRRAATGVPSYLLSFLRPHFERAGCPPTAYLGLASNAWATAWQRVDKGSFAGFLADVRRVRDIVAREDDAHAARSEALPFIAAEVRGALAIASVGSQAAEMSAPVLAMLVERAIWSPGQAIAYATRVPDDAARLQCLLALVTATAEAERPLVLAAALAELRTLLASAPGSARVAEALLQMLDDRADSSLPMCAASAVDAVLRLSLQGLPDELRGRLLAALHTAVTERGRRRGEASTAAVWQVLAGWTDASPDWVANAASMLRQTLSRAVREADSAWAGRRLALLRPLLGVDAEPTLWAGALGSAVDVLVASARVEGELPGAALGPLLAAWPLLDAAALRRSVSAVAAWLTPPQVERAIAEVQLWPDPLRRVPALAELLAGAKPAQRPLIASALLDDPAVQAGQAPGTAALIASAAVALPDAELARRWPAMVALIGAPERIVLCGDLLRKARERGLRGQLTTSALFAVQHLSAPGAREDALAGLLESAPPQGGIDPFQAWWPDAPPSALRLAMRQVVGLGQPEPDLLDSARQWLAAAPTLGADARRAATGGVDVDATEPPASAMARLKESAARPGPQAEALAAEALLLESPVDALLALRALAPQLQPATARRTVVLMVRRLAETGLGRLTTDELCGIAVLAAAGPLGPPDDELPALFEALGEELWLRHEAEPDRIEALLFQAPMPVVVREPLLRCVLGHVAQRLAPLRMLDLLPAAVARLPRPGDDLVARTLPLLQGMSSARQREAMQQTFLSLVGRHSLPRWLEVVSDADGERVASWLDLMRRSGMLDDDAHRAALTEAVTHVEPPAARAAWIEKLASLPAAPLGREAWPIAAALQDPALRLRASSALILALPRAERADALLEVLRWVDRSGADAQTARALVQMAVDLDPQSAPLMAASTRTAVAINERAARGNALATLVAVLPAELATDAVAAARRIGDFAPRVRALRALAEAAASARAVSRLIAAIEALPDARERAAATLYAAPILPLPVRWSAIAAVWPALGERPTGFDLAEILDALAEALLDAPASLLSAALAWTRALGPSGGRSRTWIRLVPALPAECRLPAIVQIGASDIDGEQVLLPLTAVEVDALCADAEAAPPGARQRVPAYVRRRVDAPVEATRAGDEALVAEVRSAALARPLAWAQRRRLSDAVARLHHPVLRETAIRYLAVLAPDGSLARAVEAAAGIDPAAERARALVRLAARQRGQARDAVLANAWAATQLEPDPLLRAAAAIDCALEEPRLRAPTLELIATLSEPGLRLEALQALCGDLDDDAAAAALPAAAAMLDEGLRVRLLAELRMAPATAAAAMTELRRLSLSVSRARVLVALLPSLPEAERGGVMAAIDALTTDFAWLDAMAAACARWPAELTEARVDRALRELRSVANPQRPAYWLEHAVNAWPETRIDAWAAALARVDAPAQRSGALCRGLLRWPDAEALLEIARAERDPWLRALALGVAGSARRPPDMALVADTLANTPAAMHPQRRVELMVEIARRTSGVPPPLFDALAAGWSTRPCATLQAFLDVAPWLDREQAAALLASLPPALNGTAPRASADLLRALGPQFAGTEATAWFDNVAALRSERPVADLLGDVRAPIEGEAAQARAFGLALSLTRDSARAQALTGIVHRLAPPLQRRLIDALTSNAPRPEAARRLACVRARLSAEALDAWRSAVERIDPAPLRHALQRLDAPAPATLPGDSADLQAVDSAICRLLDELPTAALRFAASRPPIGRPVPAAGTLLERLARMENEADRLSEITRALPRLSGAERAALVGRLDTLLGAAAHDAALPSIIAGLGEQHREVLVRVLARTSSDVGRFGRLASLLRPLLGAEHRAALLALCRESMAQVAEDSRADLLARLQAWAPLIAVLGDDAGLLQAMDAIDDAGQLWP